MKRTTTGARVRSWRGRALGGLLLLGVLSASAATAAADPAVRKHPGYVDGAAFVGLADEQGQLIEITLHGRLLQMLTRRAVSRDDPSLAGILGNLLALNAVIADVGQRHEEAVDELKSIGRRATKAGWERFVRVRDESGTDVQAFIHIAGESRHADADVDVVDGLLLIGFTEESQIIFVNLVGIVDMERIAMLGERLGVPGLDDLPPRSEVEMERKKSGTPQPPVDDGAERG